MRINAQAVSTETTSKKTKKVVARERGGTDRAMIAAEGLSNSRAASGSVPRRWRRRAGMRVLLVALGESWTGRDTGSSLGIYMPVLLQPQMTINGTPLEQLRVRANIDDLAVVEYQRLVAIDERR
jgi:hypothetical protein